MHNLEFNMIALFQTLLRADSRHTHCAANEQRVPYISISKDAQNNTKCTLRMPRDECWAYLFEEQGINRRLLRLVLNKI